MTRQTLPIRRGLTSWMFLANLIALAVAVGLWRTLDVPYLVFLPVASMLYFHVAICCHDAIHRAAHRNRRVNSAVGWVATWLFGAAFPVFKKGHLSHHARSEKPDDIERHAYRTTWQLPFRWVASNWMYYIVWPQLNRRERMQTVAVLAGYAALLVAAPVPVLLGWVIPMQLATAAFSFHTVWLPHGPLKAVALAWFPAATGYHADHHARPAYPWHQYRQLHLHLGGRSARAGGRVPVAA